MDGRDRRRLVFQVVDELAGEDLDRVLQAIAMVKRRQLTTPERPADLWIRAAELEKWKVGSRVACTC